MAGAPVDPGGDSTGEPGGTTGDPTLTVGDPTGDASRAGTTTRVSMVTLPVPVGPGSAAIFNHFSKSPSQTPIHHYMYDNTIIMDVIYMHAFSMGAWAWEERGAM